MNKPELVAILDRKAVKPQLITRLMTIIYQCDTGIYAKAEMNVAKSELLEDAAEVLTSIDKIFVS
jgi:hypothetical protein